MNVYGEVLTIAYRGWVAQQLFQGHTLADMLKSFKLPPITFTHTVAFVSDSMFKYVATAEGGDVYVKGGATCAYLAELLGKIT